MYNKITSCSKFTEMKKTNQIFIPDKIKMEKPTNHHKLRDTCIQQNP